MSKKWVYSGGMVRFCEVAYLRGGGMLIFREGGVDSRGGGGAE